MQHGLHPLLPLTLTTKTILCRLHPMPFTSMGNPPTPWHFTPYQKLITETHHAETIQIHATKQPTHMATTPPIDHRCLPCHSTTPPPPRRNRSPIHIPPPPSTKLHCWKTVTLPFPKTNFPTQTPKTREAQKSKEQTPPPNNSKPDPL